MPLIEELPTTQTTRVSHGWAYVPDTGAAIPAVQPGTRKRGHPTSSSTAARNATTTAKHLRRTEKRLADLERENHKDVAIPIPARPKAGTAGGKKVTSNVRRILGYSRNFGQFLADEEATGGGGAAVVTGPAQRSEGRRVAAAGGEPSRRKSTQQLQQGQLQTPVKTETSTSTMHPPPAPTPSAATTSRSPHPSSTLSASELEDHPLLTPTHLPALPSSRVMAALLAEPPLSYNAARAKPLDHEKRKPERKFCVVCGHWGVLWCSGCGERTCKSLSCWEAHREGCVV